MPSPRIGRRHGPRRTPSLRRSARTYVASLLVLFGFSACLAGAVAEQEEEMFGVGEKVGGAVVKADRTSVRAEIDEVVLDVTGSKLDGADVCPDKAEVFYDGGAGAVAKVDNLKVVDCVVTAGTAKIKLPRGEPGRRTQDVVVLVSGAEQVAPDRIHQARSEASVKIEVESPGPVAQPVSQPAHAPAPPPAPEQPTPPEPHHPTPPHPPPPPGAAPEVHFDVNPFPAVAGTPVIVDGRRSFDHDGTIVSYAWDLDGDGVHGDAVGETATFTPAAAGPIDIGLQVTDDDGLVGENRFFGMPVMAAGHLAAEAPAVTPAGTVRVGDVVEFEAAKVAGVDRVSFDGDGDWTYEQEKPHSDAAPATFTHTFTATGINRVNLRYWDDDETEASEWSVILDVAPVARRLTFSAAGRRGKGRRRGSSRRKFERLETTATMKLSTRLLKVGRLSKRDGEIHTKGMLLRGTIDGKIARDAAKAAPSQLKGLYRSEFAATFTGSRVMVSPDAFTMRGSGTILARPRRDKKTLVCLSMTSDGTLNPDGSTWKVVGASGKARGFTAKGTYTPVLVGAKLPDHLSAPNTLDVRAGRGKALSSSCRALAKHLPGAKRPKKRRGARRGRG